MARNPDYDITFNCLDFDTLGVYGRGIINLSVEIEGEIQGIGIAQSTIECDLEISSTYISAQGKVFSGVIDATDIGFMFDFLFGQPQTNWVKWSDIGSLDFTLNRKNLAGEAPMPWRGSVYAIKKLDKWVIVYGSGGVTQLVPAENTWGIKNLSQGGLKSTGAVTGTDSLHLFVDSTGRLWKLSDKLIPLGYEEYLGTMTSIVMHYDIINDFVYICDGTLGFVYSVKDESLGTCPGNITGVGYSDGISYVVSSSAIVTPVLELVTDIIDFETRGNKTLKAIEVGTSLTGALEVGIDFSIDHRSDFLTSPWVPLTHEGIATIPCFGKEFRLKVRASSYEDMEIDYIKVKGIVHDFNPVDM